MGSGVAGVVVGRAEGEGESWWWFGGLATIRVSGEESGGVLSHVELLYPPGLPVPRHVHHREDESWYVLDGEMTFTIGGRTIVAGPGSVVFGPRDEQHGFVVTSPHPARYLVTYAPAGFEAFIRATGVAAPARTLPPPAAPPSAEEQAEIGRFMAAEYGCEFIEEPD